MNISELSQEQIEGGIAALSDLPNQKEIEWSEFEAAFDLDICPGDIDKCSHEWRGYIQTRNMIRAYINEKVYEVQQNKRKQFQVRPENGMLIVLKGKALFESILGHHRKKVERAPLNMITALEDVRETTQLPPTSRNKLLNTLTCARILQNQTSLLITELVKDPEFELPDYSKEELLKLAYTAADDATKGVIYADTVEEEDAA